MSHDKTNDATEFARQAVERGVLNEIVIEEQRQRQELEDLVAEMRKEASIPSGWSWSAGYGAATRLWADRLAAILKR